MCIYISEGNVIQFLNAIVFHLMQASDNKSIMDISEYQES